MPKRAVQLPGADLKRLISLGERALGSIRRMIPIARRAIAEERTAFIKRTQGQAVRTYKLSLSTRVRKRGTRVGARWKDCNTWCVRYGSGPGMEICYDLKNGVCYVE